MNQNLKLIIYEVIPGEFVDTTKQYNIDLFDNEAIPINRSIIDINNFAERKSPFSKSFKIPGTTNNNSTFGYIFNLASNVHGDMNINFDSDFNPSLKANVILYRNNIVLLAGYMQLTGVTIDDNNRIEYEVDITGRTANLFQDIANLKLIDLDLSEFNHDYTKENIENSWTATIGQGYVYPLIDYGLVSDEREYFVEHMFPCTYVKTIVDKIFSEAGYRYESAFFESERFKRLIIPFSGKQTRLTDAEISDRIFDAKNDSTTAYETLLNSIDGSIANRIPFAHLLNDSSPAGYNTSNSTFTIPFGYSGRYTFITGFRFQVKNTTTNDFSNRVVKFSIRCLRGDREIILIEQSKFIRTSPFGLNDEYSDLVTMTTPEMYFHAGDIIYVSVYWPGNNPSGIQIQYIVADIPMDFYNQPAAMITEGALIILADTLADDVNQTDFLISLIKMFNLYIETDSLDDRKLIIEPRDDFYTNDIIDLTSTVDVSKAIKIEPLGALQYKIYSYAYKEDKDLCNTQHQNKFLYTYGDRRFKIINDFVKEEFQLSVIFSPTPLRDTRTKNNRVISKIWFLDAAGQRTDTTANIRILYYGGIVSPPVQLEQWFLTSRLNNISTGRYDYPYAGHLDNVRDPHFDLSFGVPLEVQYAAEKYTDSNLFNVYHKRGILDISDRNSRIVEYNLHLNEVQISKLSFRPFYYIDQHYYRLYEVEYDANSDEPVVARFLKLYAGPTFSFHNSIDINGGKGVFGSGYEVLPIWHKISDRNNGIFEKGGDLIALGTGHISSQADDALVTGRENTIMADGIAVIGGALNVVSIPGVKLMNCTGYVPQYEDEVAISNIQQPLYAKINVPASTLLTSDATPVSMIEKKFGFITEVTNAYCTVYPVTTPYDPFDLFLAYASAPTVPILFWANTLLTVTDKTRQRGKVQDNVDGLEDEIVLSSNINPVSTGDSYVVIEIEYKLISVP